MIVIYSTTTCPSCVAAKRFFDDKDIKYKIINIEEQNMSREEMAKESGGGMTVPQIVIGSKCIGGYDNLIQLHQNGQLSELLKKNNE